MKFCGASRGLWWCLHHAVRVSQGCADLSTSSYISFACMFLFFGELTQWALELENGMPRCHHTSGRNTFRPYGNEEFIFVKTGNTLACRVVLMVILCSFMNLRWVVEQPSGSSMEYLPRYQELWSLVTAPRQINSWFVHCLGVSPLVPKTYCGNNVPENPLFFMAWTFDFTITQCWWFLISGLVWAILDGHVQTYLP